MELNNSLDKFEKLVYGNDGIKKELPRRFGAVVLNVACLLFSLLDQLERFPFPSLCNFN